MLTACIKSAQESKQRKNQNFVQHALRNPFVKGERSLTSTGRHIMKKTIVILACGALIAPVAFANPRSTHKRQTTSATEQPITVTGAIITAPEEGLAASYQPFKTLVVNRDTPGRYVLDGPGYVVNRYGQVIHTAIKPGAQVRVYYANMGDLRMIDHVVVY
jgi:hypothetical protein